MKQIYTIVLALGIGLSFNQITAADTIEQFVDTAYTGDKAALMNIITKFKDDEPTIDPNEYSPKKIESLQVNALSAAALGGHNEIIDILLNPEKHNLIENDNLNFTRSVNIDNQNDDDQTAIMLAVLNNHYDSAALLKKNKADYRLADKNEGLTPLMYATMTDNKKFASLLGDKAGVVNARNKLGQTALYMAVDKENEAMALALIDTPNVDVNLSDNNNVTPLMLAAQKGFDTIVRALLDKGADIESIDKNNKTVFDYAVKKSIRELLQKMKPEEGKPATPEELAQITKALVNFEQALTSLAPMVANLPKASAPEAGTKKDPRTGKPAGPKGRKPPTRKKE